MNAYAAAVYRRAPVWGQNLLLSGYGCLLDRQRYSGRFDEYCKVLADTEWMSRADLEAYQDARLRKVVTHAYENVRFYRERFDALGLHPSDVRGQADLHKIPLLTRDDVRRHFDALVAKNVSRWSLRTGHTSGTTGTPLTVGYDRDTVWMTYAVFDRHYRWAGCRFGRNGDRVAVARGNVIVPLDQSEPPYWRENRWHNQLLLSAFHMSQRTLGGYLDAMRTFRADVIDGYPSTLYLMAKYLKRQQTTFPLRAAITSSETLYDFQRSLIEERFECRVFDYYALAERAVFSGDCDRHEGHHIAMEYGIAEVVDTNDAPVPIGTVGRLVGTSLHNLAMPLIRYVTSDVTALKPGHCSCGRQLVMMDDVTTKAEDILTLADGRLISPSVLTHPFKPLDCIEGSQIVQTTPTAIVVRLVAGPGYSDWHAQHLISELRLRLGDDVRIDVELVDRLEVPANGKFKWVVSQVPLGL